MEHPTSQPQHKLAIALVAENVSLRMSGETAVPYYYFREFLSQGHDVRLFCHERVRATLTDELSADLLVRVTFVADSALQRLVFRLGRLFPYRIEDLVFNQLLTLLTQLRMRGSVRRMIAERRIDIVFQPAPIAPTALSAMHGLGRPVVIGPMSGGMELPPAFAGMDGALVRFGIAAARWGSNLLQRIVPGKRRAAALIVANERTRAALPSGVRGRVVELMESAVDLARWPMRADPPDEPDVSFIFCGRFVDWKGIGHLVDAFAPLARAGGARLHLIGDGELFESIEAQVAREGLGGSIVLHGRLALDRYVELLRQSDVFVTPSLRECGGIAMMEAMAIGLPVIGVDWGGAAQYTSPECALLVPPVSPEALVEGLRAAMAALAASPGRRAAMGLAARRHLETQGLGWDDKARAVLAIFEDVLAERPTVKAPRRANPNVTRGTAHVHG